MHEKARAYVEGLNMSKMSKDSSPYLEDDMNSEWAKNVSSDHEWVNALFPYY